MSSIVIVLFIRTYQYYYNYYDYYYIIISGANITAPVLLRGSLPWLPVLMFHRKMGTPVLLFYLFTITYITISGANITADGGEAAFTDQN